MNKGIALLLLGLAIFLASFYLSTQWSLVGIFLGIISCGILGSSIFFLMSSIRK